MNKKIGFILVLFIMIVGITGCDDFINFTNTYEIGGTVVDENGAGIKDARITASKVDKMVYTDEGGNWNLTGLSGGSEIFVAKEGYEFDPSNYSVDKKEYGISFVGKRDEEVIEDYYKISGQIIDEDGEPISNVRLEIESDNYKYGAVYTDEDGEFEKDDLAGIVEIIPERPGYDFNPELRSVSENSPKVNFEGYLREGNYETYEVSGEIKTNDTEGIPHMKIDFYHNYDTDTGEGDKIGSAISGKDIEDGEPVSWSKQNLWGTVTIVPYGNQDLNINDNGIIFDPQIIQITDEESGLDFLLER